MPDTPESPPAFPVIPVGLATRLMQIVGAAFTVISLVSAVIDGDHSEVTVVSLVLAGLSFFVLAGGRYAQAALAMLAKHFGLPPEPASLPIAAGEMHREPEDDGQDGNEAVVVNPNLRDLHDNGLT